MHVAFKTLVLLLFSLYFVNSEFHFQQLQNEFIILDQNLRKKYCPLRNFEGKLFCPTTLQYKSDDSYRYQNYNSTQGVISGFGFDRATNEVKFPVAPNGDIFRKSFTENTAHRFSTVEQYFQYTHPQIEDTSKHFYAGIYAQNLQETTNLAKAFGSSDINIGISQNYYTRYLTRTSAIVGLPDFLTIVNRLPPWNVTDPRIIEIYSTFIKFFGTDLVYEASHGAVIYQQSSIKKCYNTNIQVDMRVDLSNKIDNKPPPSGFARFRRHGIYKAMGGNPEYGMDKIKERIATFEKAPAPIQIKTLPLWHVIRDPTRKNSVKAAIQYHIEKHQPNFQKIINEVNQAKRSNFLGNQNVYVMEYQVEQIRVSGIHHNPHCPIVRGAIGHGREYVPHCSRLSGQFSLRAGQSIHIPHTQNFIERDPTGRLRIATMENNAEKYTSPWTNSGCVRVTYGQRIFKFRRTFYEYGRLYRLVCINCVPYSKFVVNAMYGQKHTLPVCECSGF